MKGLGKSRLRYGTALLCAAVAAYAVPAAAQDETAADPAPAPAAQAADAPGQLDFSAENLEYDMDSDIVTASGNVIVERDGYRLRADRIVWNRSTGEVRAEGQVRAVSPAGDVAYGDNVQLSDSLKDGVIENMLLVLEDGARLAAERGVREDGVVTLSRAAYTPCLVETADGCPKNPTWQVKADRVVYNPETNRVTYKGARVELFGVPMIPLPGLAHSANGAPASGFLVPNFRIDNVNGVEIEQGYYMRLGPNRDLTLAAHIYTDVPPMLRGTYRELTSKGAYQLTAYGTSSRRLPVNTAAPVSERDFRGYFDASGTFQLDPHWTMNGSVRFASDRTFLRRYDISFDDRLRSTIEAERIGENSYFSLAGWAVQTLRAGDPQGQVPIALPVIDYRHRIDDPLLGGQLELQLNSLSVGRTSGQDTQRAFAGARWDLRTITSLGQEVTFTLYGRGDVYHSDENLQTLTNIYRGNPGWEARAIGTAAIDIQWPFVGPLFGGTQILRPRVQFVASPDIANLAVPNEDSRAVELATSNLFSLNRFPGYDRWEDNVRLTYGLEWLLRFPELEIDSLIGQSYSLTDKLAILPDGTGLSEDVSDIVGRTQVRYRDFLRFTHRFRLDKDSLTLRRSEVDATIGSRGTYAKIGYLLLDRDVTATIEDLRDREEIRLAGRVQVDRYWSLFGSTIIDLTSRAEDPLSIADGYEPIRHRIGIAYDDECLSLGLTWRRDYEDTGDARRGNTFLLRLAFRGLGV